MTEPENDVPTQEIALRVPAWGTPALAAVVATIAAVMIREAWAIPAFAVWGGFMGAITAVDLRELRVPNRLVGAASAVMLPLLIIATFADIAGASFWRALLGAFAAFGVYLVLNIVAPASMGMGDVKLAFPIGGHLAFLGWGPWFWAIFIAFLGMAATGIALMGLSRAGLKTFLPFGPFMVLGALVAIGLAP